MDGLGGGGCGGKNRRTHASTQLLRSSLNRTRPMHLRIAAAASCATKAKRGGMIHRPIIQTFLTPLSLGFLTTLTSQKPFL